MAYTTGPEGVRYTRKTNYYSSPDIAWEGGDKMTGTDEENNAWVITQNRC